jgi:hypothetical protein
MSLLSLRNTLYINALIFKTPVLAFKYDISSWEFASFLRNTVYIYALIFKTSVRAFKYDILHDFASFLRNTLYISELIFKTHKTLPHFMSLNASWSVFKTHTVGANICMIYFISLNENAQDVTISKFKSDIT